jgi:ureidoglycolate lyase
VPREYFVLVEFHSSARIDTPPARHLDHLRLCAESRPRLCERGEMEITLQPLTKEAFAPFGDLHDLATFGGRFYYVDALGVLRGSAAACLSVALREPTPGRPFSSNVLDRHEFSSQTFIPVNAGRWLIIVAPHVPQGGPDIRKARAFIADGRVGLTYRANTWHHGLTTLDRAGSFAIFMWKAGTGDEEFVPVEPFTVQIPE